MKIVIINDFSCAKGGATGLALLAARELKLLGIDVTLLCGDSGSDIDASLNGIEIIPLCCDTITSGKSGVAAQGIFNSKAQHTISKYIKDNDTPNTIYHLHGWSKIISPSVFKSLGCVSHRTFVHAHDFFLTCPNGGHMNYQSMSICKLKPMSISCIKSHCDKRSYPQKIWRVVRKYNVDRLVEINKSQFTYLLIHEEMRKYFVQNRYRPDDLKLVTNPVVPFLASRVNVEKNESLFFVGRLVEEKGIIEFLESTTKSGLKAEVIGDGDLLEVLKEKHPAVVFHGWLSRERIGEVMRTSARALVMPSRYPEPFGLVAAEAICSGVPVVMNDSALLSKEVEREGLGFVFQSSSRESLAEVLEGIAKAEEDHLRRISEHCFSRGKILFETNMTWIDKLVSLYRSKLSNRQNLL